jgi:hypothetical protein
MQTILYLVSVMFCLLLFTSDYSKVVQAFADKKCDCFGELVRQGETKKARMIVQV